MRLGVLDVGSNTVHLLVVDAHPGAPPLPAYSHKIELRLAEHTDEQGCISGQGAKRLATFVGEALEVGDEQGMEGLLPFATSAIREAPNGGDVLDRVRRETGVELQVLTGNEEARLTFLAVRRWFGWSSGRLLVLDIGGGSLEIAAGADEEPDVAVSLPLGAGRLTLGWLPDDPPKGRDVKALRKHVRAAVAGQVRRVGAVGGTGGVADHAVATSKTFRSLARICGAAPSAEGPFVRRTLALADLRAQVPRLASMTAARRATLPGVSEGRARQLLAGALVAEGTMDLLGVPEVEICPWALREGVILRRLDGIAMSG